MAVTKRGKSYWIDVGYRRKRYRLRSPINTSRGAREYELLIRQKIAFGKPLNEPEYTIAPLFSKIANKWHQSLQSNNYKPCEIQIRRYLLDSRIIPQLGNKRIDEISVLDIEEFKSILSAKYLSPKTINNNLSVISCCFKAAVEWGIIKEYPKIRLLKVPPQSFDFLSETELHVLISYAGGLWYDMIIVAAKTGLRIGELLALQVNDIDFEKRILTVRRNLVRGFEGSPKNNKTRGIPFSETLYEVLKKRQLSSKYVFSYKDGIPLKYNHCQRNLQKICKKAGLRKIGWHILRHSFATHLGSKGVSVITIKELLGHSDLKMTMRYTHPEFNSLCDAIQLLDNSNDTLTTQISINEPLKTKNLQKHLIFSKF